MDQEILYKYISKDILTSEVMDKLLQYVDILKSWNKKINLVGVSTVKDIWIRHILDSIQLIKYIQPGSSIIDVGSGAGFPGLVLASTGMYENVTLIDKVGKKTTFLEYVISNTGIKARVINQDVTKLNLTCDIITSRACASVLDFLDITSNIKWHSAILLKGKNVENEILEYQEISKLNDRKNGLYYKVSNGIGITNSVILEMININGGYVDN